MWELETPLAMLVLESEDPAGFLDDFIDTHLPRNVIGEGTKRLIKMLLQPGKTRTRDASAVFCRTQLRQPSLPSPTSSAPVTALRAVEKGCVVQVAVRDHVQVYGQTPGFLGRCYFLLLSACTEW